MTDKLEKSGHPQGVSATIDRRGVLKGMGAIGAASVAASTFRINYARAQTRKLRALMWEPYLLPEVVKEFEAKHNVEFAPTFFDGNSEAYNKLRVGGTKDFDLVQADGFWPRLYFQEGLIRGVDYSKMPSTENFFPIFKPDRFDILVDKASGTKFGVPFCWGSYGITYNADGISPEKASSIECLFDPEFAGRLSANARFEENIALAGVLVTYRLGTRDKPRPDGKPFNPYVLTDEELAEVEKLLIEQKKLLLTRYQDNGTLFQLLASGAIVAAPEFAQVYRQLLAKVAEGEVTGDIRHTLIPKEGGLGWVDTFLVSSGVADGDQFDLAQDFINTMISLDNMKVIGDRTGCSTTIDLRSVSTPEQQKFFLMDRTEELADMFMFDQPSSPEKWERVWSNMQAA
ncbi:MAG: extracellular solute-binding protein [Rhizobiales bacterium]|nr:extracellular solute-binding protein [Hyphomicrobiales bacterium]